MSFTDQWLHKLIPTSNLWGWYPVNDTSDLISSDGVKDESGNARDLLSTGTPAQTYEQDALNGRAAVVHDGSEFPLVVSAGVAFKHIFMVVRSTEAGSFGAFRGLITDQTAVDLLVGDNGTSTFVDFSIGGNFAYYKSQSNYAESNQQAPFDDFELVEVSRPTGGFSLTDLQIGQQKADTARRFVGKWAELICYTGEITGDELTALRLYFDLKFGLWATNSTALVFPNPSILNVHGTEKYSEYQPIEPDFDAVTVSHEYEDGGRDFNETNTDAPERWNVSILGISPEQADVYDAFSRQARIANSFTFTDKAGTAHTGVRVERYSRRHIGHKSWSVDCRFTLVKYP